MEREREILIVEDDQDIRETVAGVLEDAGYKVCCAANGLEALDVLHDHRRELPAMIVLDLMMPVMDGWQLSDRMKADPQFARIPVCVLTADGTAGKKASAMGAAMGLTKPVHIDDLLNAVDRLSSLGDFARSAAS